jgi:hypothetical protein
LIVRLITGLLGGFVVFFVVYSVSGALLWRFAGGNVFLNVLLALAVPGVLGLAAGIQTFRACVFRDDLHSFHLAKRAKKKYPAGHCQCCGYNLTGNVSGVCPECGAEIERA